MKACNFIQSCTNVERLLNSLHAYPTNSSYIQSTMRRNILQLIMTFLFNFLLLLLWQLLDIRNIFSEETETTYCSYYKVSYVVLYLSSTSPSLLILKSIFWPSSAIQQSFQSLLVFLPSLLQLKRLTTFVCENSNADCGIQIQCLFIKLMQFIHAQKWHSIMTHLNPIHN